MWVEQRLKPRKKKKVSEKAKLKAWENYIGGFDSSKSGAMDDIDKNPPTSKRLDKLFGHILEEKMRKQGFKVEK